MGIMGVKSWQKVSHLRFLLHLLMRVDRRSRLQMYCLTDISDRWWKSTLQYLGFYIFQYFFLLCTYLTLCHMYVLLKWAFFPLIFIYLMITQYIGKRKQMFRKYVRNIVLNLLTNMCSRYIINSARNTCSQTTVLKK